MSFQPSRFSVDQSVKFSWLYLLLSANQIQLAVTLIFDETYRTIPNIRKQNELVGKSLTVKHVIYFSTDHVDFGKPKSTWSVEK